MIYAPHGRRPTWVVRRARCSCVSAASSVARSSSSSWRLPHPSRHRRRDPCTGPDTSCTCATPGTAGEAAASHTHRRSFRGYEGYAYPHFLKWGYCTPTFKCYKRPSFELKLHRNAWVAAGGACSTPPDPLARLRALHLKGRGGKEMEGGREGSGEKERE